MTPKRVAQVGAALLLGSVAWASPTIHVTWTSGGSPIMPTHYEVDYSNAAFPNVILHAASTWTIWSEDGGNPSDIGTITCPEAANFTVNIMNGAAPGARTAQAINLIPTSGSNHSSLGTVELTGDCGGAVLQRASGGGGGAVLDSFTVSGELTGDATLPVVGGTVFFGGIASDTAVHVTHQLSGVLTIDGVFPEDCSIDVSELVESSLLSIGAAGCYGMVTLPGGIAAGAAVVVGELISPGTIDLGGEDIEGFLTLLTGGDGQVIDGGEVTGTVTLGGFLFGDPPTVYPFWGSAEFDGVAGSSIEEPGVVQVFGALYGSIEIAGDLSAFGTILVNRDVAFGAMLTIGGAVDEGQIFVGGNLEGAIAVESLSDGFIRVIGDLNQGSILVSEDATGVSRIVVHGSMRDGEGTEIAIGGALGSNAGIAASDYFGWVDGNDWECDATVTIATAEYENNSPGAHVWHITSHHGDVNNDCHVDMYDIDAFIMALSDPAQYALVFPGLEGSRVYHGDCDVDTYFNNFDTDAFVTLVASNVDPSDECDACGFDPEDAYTAADAANLLTIRVAEIRWNAVRAIAADIAANHPRAARRAFWADVSALLEAR